MVKNIPDFIYGTAWKEESTAHLVELALKSGFRAIDTANQAKHYSEALVGKALLKMAKNGISRNQIWLQSKFTSIGGQDHRLPYTANPQILQNSAVRAIAKKYQVGSEQIIFRFCHQIGIIPLTGTSNEEHMKADLNIFNFELLDEEIGLIKAL